MKQKSNRLKRLAKRLLKFGESLKVFLDAQNVTMLWIGIQKLMNKVIPQKDIFSAGTMTPLSQIRGANIE